MHVIGVPIDRRESTNIITSYSGTQTAMSRRPITWYGTEQFVAKKINKHTCCCVRRAAIDHWLAGCQLVFVPACTLWTDRTVGMSLAGVAMAWTDISVDGRAECRWRVLMWADGSDGGSVVGGQSEIGALAGRTEAMECGW